MLNRFTLARVQPCKKIHGKAKFIMRLTTLI
jgi:hypothetical protein